MTKSTLIAFCAVLTISTGSFSADKGEVKATETTAVTTDGNVFFTDANGKHALDPMCGMMVTVDGKTATADHEGKRYYFCNPGCAKSFTAKPGDALAKLALPAGVTAISGNKMMANCAVSNERIAVNDKTPHQVYNGRDYYFCCNKCPVSFAKNPDKYVKAVAAAETKTAAEKQGAEPKGHDEHNGHEGH